MSFLAVAPDPVGIATTLASDVGGQVVSTSVGVWPVLVPVLLTLAVIGAVVGKLGLRKKARIL